MRILASVFAALLAFGALAPAAAAKKAGACPSPQARIRLPALDGPRTITISRPIAESAAAGSRPEHRVHVAGATWAHAAATAPGAHQCLNKG